MVTNINNEAVKRIRLAGGCGAGGTEVQSSSSRGAPKFWGMELPVVIFNFL